MPKSPRPEPKPLERAFRYLALRGHSAVELERKLLRAGVSPDDAARAVAECRRLGFINDELYAQDCASSLAARGLGNARIKYDLRKRGVGEFTENALDELDETELDRAVEAARGKRRLLRRESDPRKLREKLYRYLIGRGFSPGVIRDAVERSGVPESDDSDIFG